MGTEGYVEFDKYTVKGLEVETLFFDLPLNYKKPSGVKIRIAIKRTVATDKVGDRDADTLPYLIYLQGGPGFECAMPMSKSGKMDEFISRGYAVLELDQRGTGLSTPVNWETLYKPGEQGGKPSDETVAEYLHHFRADNIVNDAEAIRKILLKNRLDQKWTIVGQSYGGFCCFTYLSFFSESIKECILTGGVPPTFLNNPDDVYRATYERVKERNKKYYEKYSADILKVKQISDFISKHQPLPLPDGGNLSIERFQQLGINFGRHNGIDGVHQIVNNFVNDLTLYGKPSFNTLKVIADQHSFDTNPIYALLHESIYCQHNPSLWSADRLRFSESNNDFFNWEKGDAKALELSNNLPLYFTGEMIYKSNFDDYINLRPLKSVAELLATKGDWPKLFDLEKLVKNEVPISAAVYYHDMYVDFNLTMKVLHQTGSVRYWITNEYYHNGIGVNPKDVYSHLFGLLDNDIE
ncbi:alpha/beta-hydrolase [Nadsonia fulvescens var. elongata DSM 6958]|uniref:Alpha/beta-hydrolase n=1 Tax=Nadsonia fulvescens var. elongata DSM 6958 TaxID=857566 RepID=A0A1E3PHU2_9ASCO|nr:alpha/beta-hydrolase [Nadsonia fulvescens var. elongata DSM 6958]